MPYSSIIEEPVAAPSGGYNPISESASSGYKPISTTPTVDEAVNKATPSLLDKLESFGKTTLGDIGNLLGGNKTESSSSVPKVTYDPITGAKQTTATVDGITAPKENAVQETSEHALKPLSLDDINKSISDLETEKSKVDTSNQDSIDAYNANVTKIKSTIDQYNSVQDTLNNIGEGKTPSGQEKIPVASNQFQLLSGELSNVLNEPIEGVGDALGDTKVFQNLAQGSDEGKFIPSFIESLASRLQVGTQAISGLTGGIIQPKIEGAPDDASTKLLSVLSQGLGMATGVGELESLNGLSAPQALLDNFKEYPQIQNLFNSLARSVPAFAEYGQLNPNLNGIQDRLKTLGTDILTAVPYTALGLIGNKGLEVPASAALGFGMAKLAGASNKDAAISATALGLLSLTGGENGETSKEVITQAQAKGQLYDQAIGTINKFSDVKLGENPSTDEIKSAFKNAALKTHPDVGGDAKDFSAVTYARDVLLGQSKTTEAQMSNTRTSEDTKADIQKTAEDIKNPPKASEEVKSNIQDIASGFTQKSPVIEGLNPNQETKLSAEAARPFAEKAADQYWSQNLKPDLNNNKGLVIGGDQLKEFFGKDFNANNHSVYSQAAGDILFKRALRENANPTVVFNAGGPGSGKTEFLNKTLLDQGFKGTIYDSNVTNYDGVVDQIALARKAGKQIDIRGIVPDLEKARGFTFDREETTGRPVTDTVFANHHIEWMNTVKRLLVDGIVTPKEVHLFDTRGITSAPDVVKNIKAGKAIQDPLAALSKISYNKEYVKQTYTRGNYTKINGRHVFNARSGDQSLSSSSRNRTDQGRENNVEGRSDEILHGGTEEGSGGIIYARERNTSNSGNSEGEEFRSNEITDLRERMVGGDLLQAKSISEYTGGLEEDNKRVAQLATRIIGGKEIVAITKDTPFVLNQLGFSKNLTDKLMDVHAKGGVQNIIVPAKGTFSKLSAFGGNTLYLNYDEKNSLIYKTGDILKHELDGHSWYSKLLEDSKQNFYDILKNNSDLIKQAWENGDNPHQNYWDRTVNQFKQSLQNKGLSSVRITNLMNDFDIVEKPLTIDKFISETLNLDKTIDALNTELARTGKSPIELKANNTIAVQEHVAMIAENASELVAPEEGALSNYIEDVNNGTLKYGPTSERALTYQGETDLSTTTLEKLKGRDTVSKQFISDLSNSGDLKQAERDIIRDVLAGYPDGEKVSVAQFAKDVKIELLPLDIHDTSSPQHEGITLPDELRGNVADYAEHIFQSPIKTSAGDIHFGNNSEAKAGYFGHTRIEDLAPSENAKIIREGLKKGRYASAGRQGRIALRKEATDLEAKDTGTTRRVIEVQSDLYQKGNLEREFSERKEVGEHPMNTSDDRKKLAQYNDPTAHFRMVREEVKKAAEDGKTKLQFPTGETAMKIEGLGESDQWYIPIGPESDGEKLTVDKLEVGKEVSQNDGDDWIISDVLGDGKFKASTKRGFENFMRENPQYTREEALSEIGSSRWDSETFDISGKVTLNPIYKFYEKDLGRYLRNKYGAQTITDDKGVTWNEVAIKPDMATAPVIAFREKTQDIDQLTKMLAKEEQNLKTTEDTKPIEKRIAELKDRLAEAKHPVFDSGDKLKDVQDTLAFVEKRIGAKTTEISKAQNMLNRTQMSLDASKSNPEVFKKVYGENRIEEHKTKISELRQKLMDLNKQVTEIKNDYKPEDLEKAIEPLKPENLAPKIRVLDKEVKIPTELTNRQIGLEIKKEALENSPYNQLQKYIAKSGSFKGELPEVTGGQPTKENKFYGKIRDNNVLEFIKRGDQIVDAAFSGYGNKPTSEEAREGMQTFLKEKENLKTERKQFLADLKSFIDTEKDKIAIEKLAQGKNEEIDKEQAKAQKIADNKRQAETLADWKNFIASYSAEMSLPQSLDEVVPPIKKGGIQSPKFDFTKWKDIHSLGSQKLKFIPDTGVFSAARDPFVRNIEKVAPRADAIKVKKFIVESVNEAGTEMVRQTNIEMKELNQKIVKDLGIRLRSKDDYLASAYSQGYISEDDFIKNTKKPDEIRKAIKIAQDYYKNKISGENQWNPTLEKYGYDPVPVRDNYLPHAEAISYFTENFGFIQSNSELPTEIVGKTEYFKPGRIFSVHQLKRMGDKSTIGLLDGLMKYSKSVNTQIYSIKPIQEARALNEYIMQYAEVAKRLGTPIYLGNFMRNFKGYIESNLAGKTAAFDRGLTNDLTGPAIVKTLNGIGNWVGNAIIMFNPSVAFSHMVSIGTNFGTVGKIPFAKAMYDVLTSPFAKDFSVIDGHQSDIILRRYPKDKIDTIWYQNIKTAGGWIVQMADRIKIRLSVASKYYELKAKGVDPEEAIKQAGLYGARIAGDQSYGNSPNLFKNKSLSTFVKFQMGMNDSISVWTWDVPYESIKDGPESEGGGATGKDGTWRSKADIWKLINTYSWLMFAAFLIGGMYEATTGTKKGIDPVDWTLTLLGMNSEGKDKDFFDRLKLAGADVAQILPFINFFTGNFIIPTAINNIVSAPNLVSKLEALGAVTIPGGTQIKKTLTGIQAYKQGFVNSKSGIPKFGVDKSGWGLLQNVLFGPSATAAAQAYYNSIGKPSAAKTTFDEVQQLLSEGKTVEATAITSAMTPKEYGTYKAEKTRMLETKAIPEAQKILDLVKNGKTDEATKLTEAMSPEDYKIYQGAKNMILKAQSGLGGNNNNGIATFEGHETYYGGSKGPDASVILGGNPDDGQISSYNPKGEPIYARDVKLEASRRAELIKQDPYWNVTPSQFDHIVPLEAGGTNTANNVMLISKAADDANNPFENYIGGLYKTGGISRADAAKASIDYKINKTVSLTDVINGKY